LLKTDKNTKLCDTLCTKFGIPIEDFPSLVTEKKKNGIRYHLMSYTKTKPTDTKFRGLNRVEEMFAGLPEYLVLLIEYLAKDKDRMDEIKGIYTRNGLKPGHFDKIKGGKKLAEDIKNHKYKKEKDWKVTEDLFEPMS
jgi:hypothetical protein